MSAFLGKNRGDRGVSVFFREKIGVTPSVAAPGDTNPSDDAESDARSVTLVRLKVGIQ